MTINPGNSIEYWLFGRREEVIMQKAVKGNAGRRPPDSSAKHAEIDAWIRTLVPGYLLLTSRKPDDLGAFGVTLVDAFATT